MRKNKNFWVAVLSLVMASSGTLYFSTSNDVLNIISAIRIPKNNVTSVDNSLPAITASRIFAGPSQYPPNNFAAYGIFAFKSRATPLDVVRHMMLCQAYLSSVPHSTELSHISTPAEQMVTVWPIESDQRAKKLNRVSRDVVCDIAVGSYGLVTSLKAIKDAELAGISFEGSGPYLLAWSPAVKKGKKDAIVLAADFSDVSTYKEAKFVFTRWVTDIEDDSDVWVHGFNRELFKDKLRRWVDSTGINIWEVFRSN